MVGSLQFGDQRCQVTGARLDALPDGFCYAARGAPKPEVFH
jgi:hypothetical protein